MSGKATAAIRGSERAAMADNAIVTPSARSIKTADPSLTQGTKTMINNTENLIAFSKGNLEAFAKSGQIWATGVQDLTTQFAAAAKVSFDEFDRDIQGTRHGEVG